MAMQMRAVVGRCREERLVRGSWGGPQEGGWGGDRGLQRKTGVQGLGTEF